MNPILRGKLACLIRLAILAWVDHYLGRLRKHLDSLQELVELVEEGGW